MTYKLIRFLKTEAGRLAILAVGITLIVVGGMLLCKSVMMHMLREGAEATSSNWVSELLAKNPDVLTLFSNARPSPQTMHVLDSGTKLGDIYRFRVWDRSGNLVFKSERLKSAGAPVVFSEKRVDNAVAAGTVVSQLHKGGQPQNVAYFVESFVPVKQNGSVIGVFDIFVDQSDDKVLYERSLFITEGIIAILVIVAAGLPGYLVFRRMLDLRAAREEVQFQSAHDSLTGLPNRNRLHEVATSALALNRRTKRPVAALMIGMDRFKDINGTFGHATSNKLLKAVAKRLGESIRQEDWLARFDGDEFVVLQVAMHQPNGARFLADRLIRVLSEPYDISGSPVTCGASIGIAIAPQDANDFDALIGCAEAALYKAKAESPCSISFFEPGMDARIRRRRQIETDIRRAIATNSFQLAYQPLYSFHDGSLLGFEALLRWPEGWTPCSPADFIPIAEESGLISSLGVWALETACKTAAGWTNPVRIAVNLSPAQFRQGNIVSVVAEALRTSRLAPERLEVEVTEGLLVQDTDPVLDQLKRLRRMGVSIALDDFGTGYSSLAYLWKFPFDSLKIDRSFVIEMETQPKAAAIVNTITALGKILDLTITAEGVETQAQANLLKATGCDRAQGYLFGRPLPVESANALANAEALSVRIWPNPSRSLVAS